MADLSGVKVVPEPTLRRLSSYNILLRNMLDSGSAFVSCTKIGETLRIEPTTVRKDLAYTGIIGKPKVGYEIAALVDAIEHFMGWKNVTEAFLVGVGSLGTALLGYQKFDRYGMKIVAAFDSDPAKVGQVVHGHEVFDISRLPDLAQRLHTLVGIITTPPEAAQSVADILVVSGLRAIWNLAPASLSVPEGIIVQNEELFSSLAILSSKLESAMKAEMRTE